MLKQYAGRGLITATLLGTAVAPWLADFNASHIFSVHWSPHARFHGVGNICVASAMALLGLWALWRRSPDPVIGPIVGAAVPMAYWGAFFVAISIPGTHFEDVGHPVPRPFGIPVNLIVALAQASIAAFGLSLHRFLNRA